MNEECEENRDIHFQGVKDLRVRQNTNMFSNKTFVTTTRGTIQ
jgi:hypothetical protein